VQRKDRKDRLTVYRTETVVAPQGRVTLEETPFDAADTVEVIVLPSSYRRAAQGLLDLFVRAATPTSAYRWSDVAVPPDPQRFEDLFCLFELSPLNRGIVRLDFDEAATLFEMISGLGHAHGVEIGRFTGGSTFLLAVAVGADGQVDSIDIAPRDDDALAAALTRAHLRDRVNLMIADARTAAADERYDFAFIDGDHAYEAARLDHHRWGGCVRPGGLVIHHDMGSGRPFASQLGDLARLRSDILRQQRAQLELVRETGSLTIFRRTAAAWIPIEDEAEG
jgi:predicted O-methyltransferase YrrM